MATKICLLIISFIGSIVVASSQELGKQRDFDIYDKPILSTFFEEAFYPRPRQELVSTKYMYERKAEIREIDMLYEIERKQQYRKEQAAKYKENVERFREKFNVQGVQKTDNMRFRAETYLRQTNQFQEPYLMNSGRAIRHPLYRSSYMRPRLNSYGYGAQIETSIIKKEEEKEN